MSLVKTRDYSPCFIAFLVIILLFLSIILSILMSMIDIKIDRTVPYINNMKLLSTLKEL